MVVSAPVAGLIVYSRIPHVDELAARVDRFRLTKHMVGGVGAGLAGFDGWLFPGEPRRWR
jgi:hypothetical protein